MNQDFSKRLQQEQNLTVGDVAVEGVGHYIDFSQKQIIYISVDEIKTREFIQTSPYKGLKRFDSNEWDVKRFFGRAQFIDSLLSELNESNLILLLGASGSGKSSVVRAGLIPWFEKKWGTNFVGLTFTPDKDPFESLYASLASQFGQTDAQIARQVNAETLVQVIKAVKQPTSHWFIFIDQFEELFTTSQSEQRDRFVSSLVRLIKELNKTQDVSIKILAAMRADFLDRLSPYRDLIRITDKHRPMITEMQPDELRLAIEQPAAHHGVVFEEGLVEEIIKDVWSQAGCLPLLQYTLNLLWETEVNSGSIQDRTLNTSTYRSLGGVRGALQKHIDEIYEALSISEQSVIQRIFLRLVSIGEDEESGTEWKPVRRRTPLSEFSEPLEQQVLKRLVDFSLLVSNRPTEFQDATIEIAHEALLTSWTTLNTWIKENRQGIALRNRLNDDVARWQHHKNEDELWAGSKLEQVLELRRDETFNRVLGGLSQSANQFIDVSLGLRERRRRRTIIGLAGFSAVALLLAGVAGWQWWRVEEQRKIALARQLAAQSQVIREQQFGLLPRGILLAIESMRRYPSVEADQALRTSLALLPRTSLSATYEKGLNDVAFSPNGEYLAIAGDDHTARVLDRINDQEIARIQHEDDVWAVAFSPDGNYLATASGDKISVVLDMISGREISRLQHEDRVQSVIFPGNSKYLLTLTRGDTLHIWEVLTGEEIDRVNNVNAVAVSQDNGNLAIAYSDNVVRVINPDGSSVQLQHSESIEIVTLSSDGRYLATSAGTTAYIWDVLAGQQIFQKTQEAFISSVAFSPDGQYLVIASGTPGGALTKADQLTLVLEIPSGREIAQLNNEGVVSDISFSPDNRYFATSGFARIWELSSGKEVFRLGSSETISALDFSPDGQFISSAGNDGTLRVWYLELGAEAFRISYGNEQVRMARMSENNALLAIANADNSIQIWDVAYGKNIQKIKEVFEPADLYFSQDNNYLAAIDKVNGKTAIRVWSMDDASETRQIFSNTSIDNLLFSPDNRYLAATNLDNNTLCLWDLNTSENVACLEHDDDIEDVTFSKDGKYVATFNYTREDSETLAVTTVWSIESFNQVNQIEIQPQETSQAEGDFFGGYSSNIIAFSPKGQDLAISLSSRNVILWDFLNGKRVSQFNHGSGIWSLTFSPDGSRLVTAGVDGTAKIWEIAKDKQINQLSHESDILDVVFSSDGKYIATAGYDNTARVWEAFDGKEVIRLTHRNPLDAVLFTPNNNHLVTFSLDQFLRVFLLKPEDVIKDACNRLDRNLSTEEWSQYIGDEPYRKTCPNLP